MPWAQGVAGSNPVAPTKSITNRNIGPDSQPSESGPFLCLGSSWVRNGRWMAGGGCSEGAGGCGKVSAGRGWVHAQTQKKEGAASHVGQPLPRGETLQLGNPDATQPPRCQYQGGNRGEQVPPPDTPRVIVVMSHAPLHSEKPSPVQSDHTIIRRRSLPAGDSQSCRHPRIPPPHRRRYPPETG